jgi:hypothetical protein
MAARYNNIGLVLENIVNRKEALGQKEIDINKQETWDSISENYDMIQGAR